MTASPVLAQVRHSDERPDHRRIDDRGDRCLCVLGREAARQSQSRLGAPSDSLYGVCSAGAGWRRLAIPCIIICCARTTVSSSIKVHSALVSRNQPRSVCAATMYNHQYSRSNLLVYTYCNINSTVSHLASLFTVASGADGDAIDVTHLVIGTQDAARRTFNQGAHSHSRHTNARNLTSFSRRFVALVRSQPSEVRSQSSEISGMGDSSSQLACSRS